MTEFTALGSSETVDHCAKIRLPVAYSYGGSAHMRQLTIDVDIELLGSIQLGR